MIVSQTSKAGRSFDRLPGSAVGEALPGYGERLPQRLDSQARARYWRGMWRSEAAAMARPGA